MNVISYAIAEPITLAQARKQCRVDPTGSPPTHVDDDLIEIFMGAAREWAETELGRIIAPTLVQSSANAFPASIGSTQDTLTLETAPVLGITSIVYDDEDEVEQTLDASLYTLDQTAQIPVVRLVSGESWPATAAIANAVRVTYTVGYSAVGDSPQSYPLPYRIKASILLVIGHLYKNRENTIAQNLQTIPMGAASFLAGISLRRGFA